MPFPGNKFFTFSHSSKTRLFSSDFRHFYWPPTPTINGYVIVEYGTRIRAVAESIQNTVKYHVEKAMGIPVRAVNVYVHGLRLSD